MTLRAPAPSTTLAAFASLKGTASLREQILEVIEAAGADGLIGDEVRDLLLARNMKDGSLNTRYSELERAGLIVRMGDTRLAKTGRQQLVMRHAKFCTEAPARAAAKLKKTGFLAGLMYAARIVAKSDDLASAKRSLRSELLKVASK
jgi:hypothetical protein